MTMYYDAAREQGQKERQLKEEDMPEEQSFRSHNSERRVFHTFTDADGKTVTVEEDLGDQGVKSVSGEVEPVRPLEPLQPIIDANGVERQIDGGEDLTAVYKSASPRNTLHVTTEERGGGGLPRTPSPRQVTYSTETYARSPGGYSEGVSMSPRSNASDVDVAGCQAIFHNPLVYPAKKKLRPSSRQNIIY